MSGGPRQGRRPLVRPAFACDNVTMVVVWFVGVVIGLAFAIWASRRALDAAVELGTKLGLSSFVIGVTIVAVGTDLPEVANSIIASARDHGDVNVGNAIGSVVTQSTIVIGVLCFVGRLESTRRFIVTVGAMTVLALLTGAVLWSDGQFGRADGALLFAFWVAGTFIIQRPAARHQQRAREEGDFGKLVVRTVYYLAMVGVGATIAVESFTRGAESLGVPEYLLSFFVLAAGTSLPELVIDYRALRQGAGQLAMGDLLGSSFVDSTLSPGIGPMLFPTVLSDGVERGSLVAAAVIAVVTILLVRSPAPTRWTGVALIGLYLILYPAVLA